jgi:hypothetical protein
MPAFHRDAAGGSRGDIKYKPVSEMVEDPPSCNQDPKNFLG